MSGLLALLAGREPEKRIGRAPADHARGERHDPQVRPGRLGPHESQRENRHSGDDPENTFHRTDVLLHDLFLLVMVLRPFAVLLDTPYQKGKGRSVTLSH